MTPRALPRPLIAEAIAVALLLGLHGWLAFSSGRDKSAVFDEIAHLGGGYLQSTTGDYRFNAESGTLPQRWAAWPLSAYNLGIPPVDHPARRGANVWILGRELLYGQGRDAAHLLEAARGMIVVISLALACLVYVWSRACHGPGGGLLSLALYALSPTMLAHARLVTADLAAAFFFLLSAGALWRLLERVTPARLAGAALAVSGLLLAKMSGVLILPMAIILILIHVARSQARARQILVIGALVVAVTIVATVAVWSAYDWRYSAQPDAPPEGSQFLHAFDSLLERAGPVSSVLSGARDARLLPEAYLWGLAYTFDTTRERDAFLRGRTSKTGWWWFFPYAVAVKTPLALFVLLALATAAARRGTGAISRGLYVPLWVLLAVYSLAAASSHLNIGHRHMLPIYPVLFIFAGAAGGWLSAGRESRRPATAVLVLLCLGSFLLESARIRPHYLSYFNQLAGGPDNGYRHLVDSSLDWGQDLPGLAGFLEQLHTTDSDIPVYAAFFGAAPPAYHRIDAAWLHSFFPVVDPARPPAPLTGGVYCISATLLQTMHIDLPGPWSAEREETYRRRRAQVERLIAGDDDNGEAGEGEDDEGDRGPIFESFHQLRSARLFAFLRRREPDTRIGYSINVYRLSDWDIERALNEPLGEQINQPPGF